MKFNICIDRSDGLKRLYIRYEYAYEVMHVKYFKGLEKKSYMWMMEHGGAFFIDEITFHTMYTLYEQISLFENEKEKQNEEQRATV
jgi:hypothetical protein